MASPIFHIGYHKTATTWFQNRFYPAVANAVVMPRDQLREILILPRALEFDVQRVHAALAALGNPAGNPAGDPAGRTGRVVFCDEELSGNIHSGGHHGCLTTELARRIHAAAPDAQVVVFLRNQVDMIASVYRQYVRVGGTYGIDRYLHHWGIRPNRAPLFDLGHFDYHRLVRYYVELFGREQVKVCLFEDFKMDNRGFLAEYARDLQLEVDLDQVDYRPELPAYGDWSLRLARLLNVFSREELPYKYYLLHIPRLHRWGHRVLGSWNQLSLLKRSSPARQFLGARMVAEIETRCGASNAALQAEFGLGLAERGYPLGNP